MICQLHEGLHLSRGCAACGRHLSLTFCRASVFKVALSGGCPEIMQLADAIQIVDTPDDSSIVYNSIWCCACPVISMRPFHRSSAFLMPAYLFQPHSTWQLLRGHSVQSSCFRSHAARGRYTDLPAFSMTCVLVTLHLTLCLCSDYGARGLYTDYRHVC